MSTDTKHQHDCVKIGCLVPEIRIGVNIDDKSINIDICIRQYGKMVITFNKIIDVTSDVIRKVEAVFSQKSGQDKFEYLLRKYVEVLKYNGPCDSENVAGLVEDLPQLVDKFDLVSQTLELYKQF